jgi:hypothetical protein
MNIRKLQSVQCTAQAFSARPGTFIDAVADTMAGA